MRATDKIHRDIEEYLKPFGLFYDRRKNKYRNEGKPIEQIISIPSLAQSLMSICTQRPNDARARPSSLLKRDEDYIKLFNSEFPVKIYLVAAKLLKAARAYLKTRDDITAKEKNNLIFYSIMAASAGLTGRASPSIAELGEIDPSKITDHVIEEGLGIVKPLYDKLGASDQIAKGPSLLEQIMQELSALYPPPTGSAPPKSTV